MHVGRLTEGRARIKGALRNKGIQYRTIMVPRSPCSQRNQRKLLTPVVSFSELPQKEKLRFGLATVATWSRAMCCAEEARDSVLGFYTTAIPTEFDFIGGERSCWLVAPSPPAP
jgi:hypothetical protein